MANLSDFGFLVIESPEEADIWRAVFAAEYVRLRDGSDSSFRDGYIKMAISVANDAVEGLRKIRDPFYPPPPPRQP